MVIGLNTMLFCDHYTNEQLILVDQVASMGYGSLEVVIGDETFDAKALGQALRARKLAATASCIISPDRAPASPDSIARKKALAFFHRCFAQMAEFGAVSLAGPLFLSGQPLAPRSAQARKAEWDYAVETLHEAAVCAARFGITLCIEPVNRYKSDIVNTAAQAMSMVDEIGLPNMKVLYDTYHANIEERCIDGAIDAMGLRYLGEIHVCDNDKGAPGSGHIDFPAVAAALRRIGYDGDVVFESFVPFGKDNIWRNLAPTQNDLARQALRYLAEIF